MSRDRKRMKRALLTKLGRAQRAETRGAGAGRKTVQGWVWTTKYDLWKAWDAAERAQRATHEDTSVLTPE
jgi:hypothetical protein